MPKFYLLLKDDHVPFEKTPTFCQNWPHWHRFIFLKSHVLFFCVYNKQVKKAKYQADKTLHFVKIITLIVLICPQNLSKIFLFVFLQTKTAKICITGRKTLHYVKILPLVKGFSWNLVKNLTTYLFFLDEK